MPKNYPGQVFGLLTAIQMMGHVRHGRAWLFTCACGGACVKAIADVSKDAKKGRIPSCGCLFHEHRSQAAFRHGYAHHPLHHIWVSMRQRCRDPKCSHFRNYGGRGIKVCERWESCKNFFEDMLPTWKPGLSLDRIDNNGDYEPGNCRWATAKEQGRNKRTNHKVRGITVTELAEQCGVDRGTIYARLRNGWAEDELDLPINSKRRNANAAKQTAKKRI